MESIHPCGLFERLEALHFFAQRADGAKLFAVDGQQWIDFVGTWGPVIHGHNHPLIRDAIAEALQKVPVLVFLILTKWN